MQATEVQRLGKLLRMFVWGQLAAGAAWAMATSAVDPSTATFRFGVLAITVAASVITLALERRGHRVAAATLLVTALWLTLAGRVVTTGSISHGAWFLFAVLVGEVGLFIGARAAVLLTAITTAFGATVVVLADRGVLAEAAPPGPWLDWLTGVLLFAVIAILQMSAVRLYRGGLDIARQASRRHRALFDGAPIALFELDLRGRAATTDVNDTALRLLGAQRADKPEIPREVLALLLDALERKQPAMEHELTLELAGEPRQVVARAELAHDLEHVIVSLADVTEQRRLAEEVQNTRRLEAVANLAGSVAHDFNNLLTISQMNAARLGRRMAELSGSRELERIRDANTRASTLTRQLLVFSRRDVVHRQVFEPDGVIQGVEPLLRRTLDSRVELVVALGAEGAAIDMDPTRLELLVTNLVHNGVDAIGERGTVRIETRRRTLGDEVPELAAGDYVSITVADTGEGMAEDIRDRAFEPFFTTRAGKRVGLGLAIVRNIAADAGGTVVLDSSPAGGTRVEVLLPLTTPQAARAEAAAGNERILLVEDDDGVREVARSTLEEAGYAVVAVRSGNEALATIATGPTVDLVVSDLVMPGIGGRELVDRLRATHPELPVLYVSGFAADGPPRLDGENRVSFLAKPFTPDQLLASVRSVLPS